MKAHTSSPALLGADCISWRWPYQHLSPRPRALGGLCAPAHLEPRRTWLLLLAEVRCYFYDFCCQLTKVAQLACSTLSVSLETCLGTPEPACKKSGSPKAALLNGSCKQSALKCRAVPAPRWPSPPGPGTRQRYGSRCDVTGSSHCLATISSQIHFLTHQNGKRKWVTSNCFKPLCFGMINFIALRN